MDTQNMWLKSCRGKATPSSPWPSSPVLVPDSWQDRLKAELPREEIPGYLSELQALVAELRRWRDAQRVPTPADIRPSITTGLQAHPELTVAYITDPRYAEVVQQALAGA